MDAATPRNPSNDQRALRTPPTIPSVFANLPDNNNPRLRHPRQVKLPRQEAAGALVFARDASRHGCRRVCKARGPEARYDQAHPTPELPQGSRQDCRRV